MFQPEFHLDIIFIFFLYGLAFFSMGLAMFMESRRSPLLAEARVLLPLALFGFIHGIHEWMEMTLMVRRQFGLPVSAQISLIRLALLILSFTFLMIFGLRVLRPQGDRLTLPNISAGIWLFAVYILLILVTGMAEPNLPARWSDYADSLARYILAVPGACLAALALFHQASMGREVGRYRLWTALRFAAWSLALYGLTQLFVRPMDFFPASFLNTQTFNDLTGVPIQVVRTVLAVSATLSLIWATQIVDSEREHQLLVAQNARLDALEQLERDMIARETMRRELLRHTVIAQEEERGRIARELHDETAQFLTALRLTLATLRQRLPNTMPKRAEANELIERLERLSREMSQGIYRMVHDLRPAQLDDLGLVAALQHLVDEERSRSGMEVNLKIEGDRQRLDPLVETVFFRVAQEALSNVSRHAGCNQADLELSFSPQEVALRVKDQGVGFDLNKRHSPPCGWGLDGMRERAESVGGDLHLQSAPGQGTQVEIVVPVQDTERAKLEEKRHE